MRTVKLTVSLACFLNLVVCIGGKSEPKQNLSKAWQESKSALDLAACPSLPQMAVTAGVNRARLGLISFSWPQLNSRMVPVVGLEPTRLFRVPGF